MLQTRDKDDAVVAIYFIEEPVIPDPVSPCLRVEIYKLLNIRTVMRILFQLRINITGDLFVQPAAKACVDIFQIAQILFCFKYPVFRQSGLSSCGRP